VKPDRRAPVAVVKVITAATVAPIAGRPEESDTRRKNPGARDPIITEIGVGPVARGPNIARGWAERLLVDRYRRWSDPHRDGNKSRRRRRSQRQPQANQRGEHNGRKFSIHIQVYYSVETRDAIAPRTIQTKPILGFIGRASHTM